MRKIYLRSHRLLNSFLTFVFILFAVSSVIGQAKKPSNTLWGKGGKFEGYAPEQEVKELRTKNAKHFRNPDGSFTVQTGSIYHYKDESGKWQEIELNIQPTQSGFVNTANEFKSSFPVMASKGTVAMQLNNNTVFNWWSSPELIITNNGKEIHRSDANAVRGELNNNVLSYDAYTGISEEFVMLQNGIENNTIIRYLNDRLNNVPVTATLGMKQFIPLQPGWSVDVKGAKQSSDFTTQDFHIAIPGTADGIYFSPIVVFDKKLTRDEAFYVLYAPLEKLTESEKVLRQQSVTEIQYKISFVEGGIEVTAQLPVSWLKAPSRSFPVTIDPTVTVTPPSPTSGGNFYGPMCNWYGFARHADIYLASELNLSFVNITDIEYYRVTTAGTNASKPIKIYMRTTAASTLTGLTDAWNSNTYTGGLTPNYDGTMDLHGTTTGWKMISFTTPFQYQGSDNLIIMGYDAYGGGGSAKYLSQGATSVVGRQAYKRQDTNDPGDASTMAIEDRLTEVRLTYASAGPPCTTPSAQPTALSLNPVGVSAISGSFTAAAGSPDRYLVVRTSVNTAPTPVDGTTYSVGNNAIGYIVSVDNSTTFNNTGLTPATTYYYWVYSYNYACSGGPLYRLASPLTGSASTNACGGLAGGTYTVGPTGNYASVTAALAAASVGVTGPAIFELQPTYSGGVETYPISFTSNVCLTATNSITIRPAAGAVAKEFSSSDAIATIDFNGAKYITIDGRPGGSGTASQLSIVNTATTGVAMRFINDAQNNLVKYCDIQGQNTAAPATGTVTNAGVVYFSNTNGTGGNDKNTIDNCKIHGTPGANPAIAIFGIGSTANVGVYNDSINITNNQIYDYFIANNATTGIKVDGGNNAWTISNNHFFQTQTLTYTSAFTHRVLWITPNTASISNTASGFIITNNKIGGSDVNAGGTPYTINGTVANVFNGMDLSVGLGDATSVQGNTIANISLTTSSTGNAFVGIGIANGNNNIGTVTGNTIGSMTGAGISSNASIVVNGTGSAGTVFGIRVGAGTTNNVSNNKIGSIDVMGSGTVSLNFIGIGTGGGTNLTVTNNRVGGDDQSSIRVGPSSSGTVQSVTGINIANGTTTSATGNIIQNLTNEYTGSGAGLTKGIIVSTTAGLSTISNNIIRNLYSASPTAGSGSSCAIIGIDMRNTNALGCNVIGNTIDSLVLGSSSSTAAMQITGIFYNGTTSVNNIIAKNFIHSFDVVNANSNVLFTAIDNAVGTNTFANNMIRLGIKPDGTDLTNDNVIRGISSNSSSATNLYHNTIYIGGSNVGGTNKNTYSFIRTGTSGTYEIKNNIFINNRSNAGAGSGGKHYTMYFTTATTGVTASNNVYRYTGNDGNFAFNGTADVPAYTSGWIASDVSSIVGNPQLINPTGTASTLDLHIHATNPTPIEGAGTNIASVTDDFDGQTRSGLTPVDIGADAGNFVFLDLAPPTITYTPLAGACNTSDRTITATITDGGGIASGANTPRIYYRQNGGAWAFTTGVNTSGSSWDFTLAGAGVGGFTNLSLIEYFIVAQDNAGNIGSNPGGAAGTVQTITTYPPAPASYTIAVLNGSYNVGSAQAAPLNSLTAAINVYNGACLTGHVTFRLTDADYSSSETFPLSINANPTASASKTLTIRPALGNTVTVTGSVTSGGLIKLNGADYVIIDGSSDASGNKDLSISNTSTTTPAAVTIVSLGAGTGATHDTIRNCNLITPLNVSGYGVSVGAATPGSSGADNDSVAVHNNNISNAAFGIYAIGTAAVSAGGLDSLSIVGNTYNVTTSVSSPIAIRVGNALKSNVNLNTISLASSATGQAVGISLETGFVSSNVLRNLIKGVTVNVAGGYGGRGITVGTGTATSDLTIANNMISGMNGSNWTAFGNSSSMGIAIGIIGSSTTLTTTTGGIRLYYNSVNLYGPYGQTTSTTTGKATAALYVGSGASALDIRNNIFSNSLVNTVAAKAYAVYSAVANTAYTTMNYNDYYVSGTQGVLAYLTSDRATLADIQTGFGQNVNSKNEDPTFLAQDDLHVNTSSTMVGQAIPIAGVTNDIDGDTRDAGAPTIGADEIVLPPCTGAVGGTASATTTALCGSGSTNITATGFSTGVGSGYQWQSSTNNTLWNDMAGQVSSSVNTGTISATMYYRFKVTCPTGTAISYSNVVTITVNPNPTVTVSPAGPVNVCEPATPVLNITNTSASAPVYQWRKGGSDLTGETGTALSVTSSGSYTVRVEDGVTTCFVISTPVVVTINPQPTPISITPSPVTICPGSAAQLLSTTGGSLSGVPILSEDFNGTPAGWTTTNTSTGTTPANAAWTGRPSPYTPGGAWTEAISSNDNSQFYLTNSDAVGSGAAVNTSLITPVFSTVGYTSAQLSFYHYFRARLTSNAKVEITTNGTTWTTLATYTTNNEGGPAAFANALINLDAYVNNASVQLRFVFNAGWDWGWAIDNLVVSGTAQTAITWSPTTGLFIDAAATTAYTGTATSSVYAKPASTQVYTATATSSATCTNTGTVTVNYTAVPTNSTALAGTAGGAQVCANYNVSVNHYFNNCDLIATVVPGGASPVSGNVNACVKIETGLPTDASGKPYVARHYDILPAASATTATSTITLYFTQAEFNAYNAGNGAFPDLPTGTADAAGKANLRISQFNSTTSGGLTGYTSGSGSMLDPVDANIVFDAPGNRWKVTFDAVGSGGFYVHTGSFVLPVTGLEFTGEMIGTTNKLSWRTATENNNKGFELQRSANGTSFSSIAFVATKAENGNSTSVLSYVYNDAKPFAGSNYYRLKQIDKDGKFTYSNIVLLGRKVSSVMISGVYPNPTEKDLNLVISSPKAERVTIIVTDLSGKHISQQSVQLVMGENQYKLNVQALSAGTYLIKAICAEGCETAVHRFVKQ